jgi:hypothetical protein
VTVVTVHREALAMQAERRIDSDKVVDVLEAVVSEQGRRPRAGALR